MGSAAVCDPRQPTGERVVLVHASSAGQGHLQGGVVRWVGVVLQEGEACEEFSVGDHGFLAASNATSMRRTHFSQTPVSD